MIIFLFLTKGINLIYFTYPDESRNAFASYYMIFKNSFYNWIVPYYNGDIRYDKPPLIYYLANIFYFTLNNFNISIEVCYRLVSAFSMFFSAIIVFKFAKILFNEIYYRYLSVVIFVSFVNIFIESKAFVPEPLFTLFILASFYSFFRFYQTQNYFYLNWFLVFSGLANFAKGIVSYIVIFLPILIFLFYNKYKFNRIFYIFFNKNVILGWIFHIVFGYAWFILVYLLTNGEFIKNFFFVHNFGRFIGTSKMHLNPAYFYIIVIFINILPIWELISLIFTNFNRIKFKNYLQNLLYVYLFIIFIFIFLFYSLSKGKVHHYIMPVYLPLALFITSLIKDLLQSDFKLNLVLFFIFSILFSIILYTLEFNLNDINFINKDKIVFNLIYLNLFYSFLIIFVLGFYFLKAYRVLLLFVFTFIKIILFYYYLLNDLNLKELSKNFINMLYISKKSQIEIITLGDIASVSFYNLYLNKLDKTVSLEIYNYQNYIKVLDSFGKDQYIVFLKEKYYKDFEKNIISNYKIVEVKKIFLVQSEILVLKVIKLKK